MIIMNEKINEILNGLNDEYIVKYTMSGSGIPQEKNFKTLKDVENFIDSLSNDVDDDLIIVDPNLEEINLLRQENGDFWYI